MFQLRDGKKSRATIFFSLFETSYVYTRVCPSLYIGTKKNGKDSNMFVYESEGGKGEGGQEWERVYRKQTLF